MKIEHIAIYVKDLESSRNFFQQFFGGISNDGYYNPKTGLRTYFLTFEDGARLELMNRTDMASKEKLPVQTGYAHLAFCVGSREKVDELTERLSNSGYPVINGPRTTGDGYYESCVLDGENNQIEITV
ncbi:VOC family protein [Anaerocolumna sp. AGMB13020]|uniref:VOC family protein n=1 Tax=Anaerocolumna sp. AGMB13020 TaxID=3081750 RepID=UPI002953B537|nr:VOC family protein [Anaerocolumna sp. AGMB13020]WOO35950.1 VOC family protein [Anaerocolumna sp. AGMB13020]